MQTVSISIRSVDMLVRHSHPADQINPETHILGHWPRFRFEDEQSKDAGVDANVHMPDSAYGREYGSEHPAGEET